ncbi:MAG: hypothetical protein KJ792_01035 [Actinobacteria bacterium]|nr:hypothetical protein [Actinomycetota bacterium]
MTEVAELLPVGSWALVGGLMVQLHARAAGINDLRPTADVDMLVDALAAGTSVAGIAARLRAHGFEVVEPGWPNAPTHRLRRSKETIDLLVADRLPSHTRPRLLRRPVMAIDGGAQALARTRRATVSQDGRTVELMVPDLLGALVLKGAAHAADSRDRERHLRDSALLASLITDHAAELTRLRGSDAKRLRHLRDALADPLSDAWLLLPDAARLRGQDTLRILAG